MENAIGNTPTTDSNVQIVAEQSSMDTLPTQSADSQALTNELEREKARARTAQQEADRLRKELRAYQNRVNRPTDTSQDVEPETNTSSMFNPNNERVELERGIFKMMLENQEYKQVLDSDQTLKTFFEKDPLSIARDAVDVNDALYQIKRFFDDKVYEAKIKSVSNTNVDQELNLNNQTVVNSGKVSAMSAEDMSKLSHDQLQQLLKSAPRPY